MTPITLTDTVVIHNDPLYEVPVSHTPPGMDPTTTSLCYQIHGESRSYYNLISDDCIQVNVLYRAMKNPIDGNAIKELGIVAHNNGNNCTTIKLEAKNCIPIINRVSFDKSYNKDGIIIEKIKKRSLEVTIPNCKRTQGDDVIFKIVCYKVNKQKTIRFDVSRGGGLKPGAHGLIGKKLWTHHTLIHSYAARYRCILYSYIRTL